ncbi:MAG: DUF1761 domain-containing protein [Bacteroidota bacterium]
MEKNIKINHGAVLVAAILCFALAMVWYGPLFGKVWAKGAEVSNPQTPPIWATITSFFLGLFSCYGIAYSLKWARQTGAIAGLLFGGLVAGAFLLQVVIGPWLFAGRFLLFAVNMPYFTLCALLSGLIIGRSLKPVTLQNS